MKPILYPSSATTFNNQGLGALSDAISCVVSEERNGEYELTMEYPVGGIHFDEIGDRAIICAIPSPYRTPQPFRIYSVESPLNGIVTIHAHHLSYDLSGIPVSPFTASSCSAALSGLLSHSVVTNPFTVWTDKSVIGEYKLSVPTSFRACLGGQEGSILDVYGKGEYEFDKYAVKLHLNRGSDNGVKIAYGKNLTDFRMERNLESVVTGIYPYWANVDEDEVIEGDIITIYDKEHPAYLLESGGAYLIDADDKYLLVENPFTFDNVIPLDLSSEFETAPTKAELKERAEKYIRDNGLGAPKVSIDVSFVQLEQTEEYKDIAVLEACDLCDIVTVEFPLYGISAKAEIIRIETDVLLEKYNAVQIGDARTSIADTLAHLEVSAVTKQEVAAAAKQAGDVLNNTKGTFEYIPNGDGTNSGFNIFKADGTGLLRCTAGGIGVSPDGGLTYTNAIGEFGVIASELRVEKNGVAFLETRLLSNVYGIPQLIFRNTSGKEVFKLTGYNAGSQFEINDSDGAPLFILNSATTGSHLFFYDSSVDNLAVDISASRTGGNDGGLSSISFYDASQRKQAIFLASWYQDDPSLLVNDMVEFDMFDIKDSNNGTPFFRVTGFQTQYGRGANIGFKDSTYGYHIATWQRVTINGTTYYLLGATS